MAHIGIIGAGAAGLAAAWEVTQQGHQATVFEAGDRLGGLAAGFKDDAWDWSLEKFYHHWFQSDEHLLALTDELGTRDKVIFLRPKSTFWLKGGIYQMDDPLSALLVPVFSWYAKLRYGPAGFYYLRLRKNWQALEQYTAAEWIREKMGEEYYELMWKPSLIGKFGHAYEDVNMAWLWARMHSRTPKLGTYIGGFQAFMEDLGAALRARGVDICLKTPVVRVEQADEGGMTLTTPESTHHFDAVISTTSPRLLLKLAPSITGDYAEKVSALRSMGAVVVILALKQQLLTDGTYWLTLPASTPDKSASHFPFLALVEHTNYLKPEYFGGDHLVYLGDYVAPDHEYFQLSEDELAERFIEPLTTFNPDFSRDWIRKRWVFRAPYAQPLPTVNHSQNIPDLRTPVDGLYWASMSQVYPWDRGTNYAVEIGRRVARLVLDECP
ncbi:MAG: NAD(P)/FAD-dependent oxidoreductase [Anaerolineales bacterium]